MVIKNISVIEINAALMKLEKEIQELRESINQIMARLGM